MPIERQATPFPVLQSLCSFLKSTVPTHCCVLMRLPESFSRPPRFPIHQKPRHAVCGAANCLLRPYTARLRPHAQAPPHPPFAPSVSLPSMCVPPSPSLPSALPLCPFLLCGYLCLCLSFAFPPVATQPLSLPLSLNLTGPPFALWVCSQAKGDEWPLCGRRRPLQDTGLQANT